MRYLAPLVALVMVLPACAPEDADGDGVPASLDCDDNNFAIYPGATEICDGVDNDCNQVVDDDYARGGEIFFLDRDGDGYGVWEQAKVRCDAPAGYVDNALDCGDDDADVFPGAPEFCDRIDQDCNGETDDNPVDGDAYYTDYDQDGFGDIASVTYACEQPEGFISTGGDCDDFNEIINPRGTEVCNQIDDNCNGIVDDADSEDATIWYEDRDGDGFGSEAATRRGCTQPEYFVPVEQLGDCDDTSPTINPAAAEVCNDGIDNNCNGSGDQCTFSNWEFGQDDMAEFQAGRATYDYGTRDLSIVGDVNGDGIDDVVIGLADTRGPLCSASGSYDCGEAQLYLGGAEMMGGEFTNADAIGFETTNSYDDFGYAIAGLGDFDGDGFDDFAVGARYDDTGSSSAGSVYVVFGQRDMGSPGDSFDVNAYPQIFETNSSQYLGSSVTGGDHDGDGYADLVMSAYRGNRGSSASYPGNVYLKYGGERFAYETVPTDGYFGVQSSEYLGGNSYGHGLGHGDFNADGVDDLAIGSYYYDNSGNYSTGRVYLVYNSAERVTGLHNVEDSASATFTTNESYSYVGTTATGVGDTNGDGYEDLVVCGYGLNSYAGQCSFYLGQSEEIEGFDREVKDKDDHDFTAVGSGSSTYLGAYGLNSGDYDGDGLMDVGIGEYRASDPNGSNYAGGVMLIPGSEEHESRYTQANAHYVYHTTQYAYFGYGVGLETGDINGDGVDDMLVGAYGSRSYQGDAYAFFGGTL